MPSNMLYAFINNKKHKIVTGIENIFKNIILSEKEKLRLEITILLSVNVNK
jgi:hypothetical protein